MNTEIPVRATRKDIAPGKEWALEASYEVEKARIASWLRERARELLFQGSKPAVLDSADAVVSLLEGTFATPGGNDPETMGAAARGDLARTAPSRSAVASLGGVKSILVVAEVAIFVWLWLSGQAGALAIPQGVLLAGGGYLAGVGLADLLADERTAERRMSRVLFPAGVLLVLMIAGLRASLDWEEGWPLILGTLALAIGITLFEALHRSRAARREAAAARMFSAQLWWATEAHRTDRVRGNWQRTFSAAVEEFAKERGEALERAHGTVER